MQRRPGAKRLGDLGFLESYKAGFPVWILDSVRGRGMDPSRFGFAMGLPPTLTGVCIIHEARLS